MKTIILLFLSINCYSQKIALIDRDFKKPILFTDSVTINQVSNNYFPIEVSALDSFVANLQYIKGNFQVNKIQRSKILSYRLQAGKTSIKVETVPHAYGDSYNLILSSKLNNVNADYLLGDHNTLLKGISRHIDKFIKYIQSDSSLNINTFKEYQPVQLDATIYIGNK